MKLSRHILPVAGLLAASWALPLPAAAPGSTPALPVYELKISSEEWAKLQRAPRSNDRQPATFSAGGREYSVGVRYRGDFARSWPKKPLKIFFAKDKEFESHEVLNLNSNWRDPAFIREGLAYHIYSVCGAPTPQTRMVKLNVNGQFYGVFIEVEQPEKVFLKRTKLKGATVYKANSPANRADERDLGSESTFRQHYEKQNHKTEDYRDLQSFCHALATTKNVGEFFTNHVVLDAYVNYLAATTLVQNWDGFNKNHILVHDTAGSGKWLVVPWDLDRTLGDHWSEGFDEARLPLNVGTAARPGTTGWNRLFEAFSKDPGLWTRFLARLDELLRTEFTREKLFPVVDRMESELGTDAIKDRQRWPKRDGNNIHAGIEEVKRYLEERRAFLLREVKAQLRANNPH